MSLAVRKLMSVVVVVFSLAVSGCDSAVDRATAPETETSTSPGLVAEATEFGGWVLPEQVTVLLVDKQIVRDRKYRLAVRMSPGDLTAMLERSRFATAFETVLPEHVLWETIAGPDPASSPKLLKAQDTSVSSTGKSMFRRVLVDERDAGTLIVHVEFRGI